MNREILFRGKRIDNGEWVYGVPLQHYDGDWQIMCGKVGASVTRTVVYETVGQYTGLTDKNGVRIFEGDIVKYRDKIYEIIYFTPQARFLAILPNGMFNPAVFLNCEVIGNIHDNPEMMGGETNV